MYSHDGKEWFPATFYKKWIIEARLFFRIYPNRIYNTPVGIIIPTLQPLYYVFYKVGEPILYLRDNRFMECLNVYVDVDFDPIGNKRCNVLSPIAEESPKHS
jgi:hypothetical protein